MAQSYLVTPGEQSWASVELLFKIQHLCHYRWYMHTFSISSPLKFSFSFDIYFYLLLLYYLKIEVVEWYNTIYITRQVIYVIIVKILYLIYSLKSRGTATYCRLKHLILVYKLKYLLPTLQWTRPMHWHANKRHSDEKNKRF